MHAAPITTHLRRRSDTHWSIKAVVIVSTIANCNRAVLWLRSEHNYLAVESESEQHEEEENRPDGRERHAYKCFRISNKRKADTRVDHFLNLHALRLCQEAHHTEDGKTGEHTCQAVATMDNFDA